MYIYLYITGQKMKFSIKDFFSKCDQSTVSWYFWVFIMNLFSFSCIFFFSRKLCFLWSPCLLFIAELISLDTSSKDAVRFFLKITFPSWIIFSISLDELNSIYWLLKSWWLIFWNNFYFIFVKEFWYGKKY